MTDHTTAMAKIDAELAALRADLVAGLNKGADALAHVDAALDASAGRLKTWFSTFKPGPSEPRPGQK
jgi:hypothetical protein